MSSIPKTEEGKSLIPQLVMEVSHTQDGFVKGHVFCWLSCACGPEWHALFSSYHALWEGSLTRTLPPMKGLTATVPPLSSKRSHCNSSFSALLNSSLLPILFLLSQSSHQFQELRLQLTHLGPPQPWLRSAIPNVHQSFFPPMLPYKKWLTCTLKIEAVCSSKMMVSTYQTAMCH